jgi:hypothetical protein
MSILVLLDERYYLCTLVEKEKVYCWCTQAGRGGDVLLVNSSYYD